MKKIILQHIVMSSNIVPDTDPLFCKDCRGPLPISLDKGEVLNLRAHFNFIPIGVLAKMGISDITIYVEKEGDAKISLFIDDCPTPFHEGTIDGPVEITVPDGTIMGIMIEALEKCTISGGEISCRTDRVNTVRLKHVICTYRREKEMVRKIDSITRYMKEYGIGDEYELIVIDNGGTLNIPGMEIINSKNLGGSAGFSRGMMDAIKKDGTHILLNDDDAVFEPEILFRTISLLSVMDRETIIGGSMISLKHPFIINESGAYCDNKVIKSLKHGTDISDISGNVDLARPEKIGHTGWWYSVFPASLVKEIGYSLPFFIKEDDVEYGLRAKMEKITVCGITVWHPGPRYDPSLNYYYFRNHLSTMATHEMLDRNVIKLFTLKIWLELSAYRYDNAEMMILGIKDFLKGPDYVYHKCEEKRITSEVQLDRLENLRKEDDFSAIPPKHGVIFRLLTMNGLFFKSIGCTEKSVWDANESDFYRIKRILYRVDDDSGFIADKSIRKTVLLSLVSATMYLRLLLCKKGKMRTYSEKLPIYSSEEQWKKVLEIDE